MKHYIGISLLLAVSNLCIAQIRPLTDDQRVKAVSDFVKSDTLNFENVKARLDQLLLNTSEIQERSNEFFISRSVSTPIRVSSEKEELIAVINRDRSKAVQIAVGLTVSLSGASSSIDFAMESFKVGAKMQSLSTPFLSATFTTSYNNIEKLKFLPSVILPLAAILIPGASEDQKIGSVAVGASLTGILHFIKLKPSKDDAKSATTKKITETMDLFNLNRAVYVDMEKIVSYAELVMSTDPTLSSQFTVFKNSVDNMVGMSDTELASDPRFETVIGQAQDFFSRFDRKLSRVDYLIAQVEASVETYKRRPEYISAAGVTEDGLPKDIRERVDQVGDLVVRYAELWAKLKKDHYSISSTKLNSLNSFNQLSVMINSL